MKLIYGTNYLLDCPLNPWNITLRHYFAIFLISSTVSRSWPTTGYLKKLNRLNYRFIDLYGFHIVHISLSQECRTFQLQLDLTLQTTIWCYLGSNENIVVSSFNTVLLSKDKCIVDNLFLLKSLIFLQYYLVFNWFLYEVHKVKFIISVILGMFCYFIVLRREILFL